MSETVLPRDEQALRDVVSRRLELIGAELDAEGYRSKKLVDHLASLGALYQELGEDLLAVSALDWALQISRVNYGLYSLDDAALIEPMIESVTALADYETARSLEGRLVELTFRNPNDPRVMLILASSADRRMREAERILEGGESVNSVAFAVGQASPQELVNGITQARRRAALAALAAARRQYIQAIAAGVRNGGYSVLDLLELEDRLLATFYLEMAHPELADADKGYLCRMGENVISTSVGNVSRIRESPTAAANRQLKLADWRLVCSRNGRALETYDDAYATLLEHGVDEAVIDELLSPEIPADIKQSFRILDGDQDADDYRGFIDVSFVVGKYGTARDVNILATSPGTGRDVERQLRAYIESNRFRPRFVDGERMRGDRVAVRYYYR